jgi:enamine deaminase RidA (YjgF/YER057c/UK114 family)
MNITRMPGSAASRSAVVVANGFAFTVATSDVETTSMYEQTRSTLAALDRQLAGAGVAKSRIVTAIVYIADMSRKAEMNRAWEAWVDMDHPPMRACIGAALEAGDLIEIVVTAVATPDAGASSSTV